MPLSVEVGRLKDAQHRVADTRRVVLDSFGRSEPFGYEEGRGTNATPVHAYGEGGGCLGLRWNAWSICSPKRSL